MVISHHVVSWTTQLSQSQEPRAVHSTPNISVAAGSLLWNKKLTCR